MLGTTFSLPGAIIRKLKVGLFISRGQHWRIVNQRQPSGSAFYFFALLLFAVKVGLFISRVFH